GPGHIARCDHPWRRTDFPALVAVIEHAARGIILWDTGYSPLHRTLHKRWPWRLQEMLLPVHLPETSQLPRQLAALGIAPRDVGMIVLSHFHSDHMGGLRDFPQARILFSQTAWNSVRTLGPWTAARHSYHPGLLPDGFPRPGDIALNDNDARPDPFFAATWPLLDGAATAVSLPGHAPGQIGLRLASAGRDYLLVADALWLHANLHTAPPSWLGRRLMDNPATYDDTRARLQRFAKFCPHTHLVPSHCAPTLHRLQTAASPE
ncbi:MAG: MBL fold metallo-hydrolase, partial [Opitutaceae bacterium]|nr:MBL fold metallo-hydrolase [Opitutaceae bacterium]